MGVAQKNRTTPGGIARIGVAPQVGLEPTTLRLTVTKNDVLNEFLLYMQTGFSKQLVTAL